MTLHHRDAGQVAQRDRLAVAVPGPLEDRQRLLQRGLGLRVARHVEQRRRLLRQRGALHLGVAGPGEHLPRLAGELQRGRVVAHVAGQHAEVAQPLADHRRHRRRRVPRPRPARGSCAPPRCRSAQVSALPCSSSASARRSSRPMSCASLDRLAGQPPRLVVLALHEGPVGADRQQLHLARRVEAVLQGAHLLDVDGLPLTVADAFQQRLEGDEYVEAQQRVVLGHEVVGLRQQVAGLPEREHGSGPLAGAEVPRGRLGVVGPVEVLGDDRGVLLGARDGLAGLDEPPGRAAVVAFALRTQDAVVRHVAQQRVLEQELPGRREP